MAVALEFIDLIVPIELIRKKYTGGWDACLRNHKWSFGFCIWHDDHLFRDGAMNPADIRALIKEWEDRGFEPMEERNGVKVWKDLCVVEGMSGGPTLPCDWIEVDTKEQFAYLKGTEPGEVVRPKRR